MTQFKEAAPGLSGYTWTLNFASKQGETFGASFSIVDKVVLPPDLPLGDYWLSWRWDAEGTFQVWENCADVRVVA